ncbi:MAG: BlaI/MecI/CopY family transcriptional regulator [Eubacteriales bacterium]|nr:BlaI/MecI/CopY family transcriptional regulator [Eubacteriales bacterium]
MSKTPLTDAEAKIMQLLWEENPLTTRQITEALESETHWTKYTVITLLKRMQQKGTVRVDESGAVKTYAPAVDKRTVAAEQTRSLVSRMFSGKASLLVSNLVEEGGMTDEELREIEEILRRAARR